MELGRLWAHSPPRHTKSSASGSSSTPRDSLWDAWRSRIAHRLRGKHKAVFTPHVDTGDFIVVVNAEKVKLTGNKRAQKIYYRHTGYPGGIRSTPFEKMIAEKPTRVIELAVKGMLPKGPLGRDMYRKLHVYAGSEHRHAAQQPAPLTLS